MEIVLATANLHKVRELKEMLKGIKGLEVISLAQFPQYTPPEETGATFSENAEIKALHAAIALNRLVIADDSGLVVPALNHEPGVRSRRFAGEEATDAENRKKLIAALKKLDEADRSGYFECALCLSGPEGVKKTVLAKVEGTLTTEELGSDGFGYDPLFKKLDYDKTFSQIGKIKDRVSHRAKAVEKLLPSIEALLTT